MVACGESRYNAAVEDFREAEYPMLKGKDLITFYDYGAD